MFESKQADPQLGLRNVEAQTTTILDKDAGIVARYLFRQEVRGLDQWFDKYHLAEHLELSYVAVGMALDKLLKEPGALLAKRGRTDFAMPCPVYRINTKIYTVLEVRA